MAPDNTREREQQRRFTLHPPPTDSRETVGGGLNLGLRDELTAALDRIHPDDGVDTVDLYLTPVSKYREMMSLLEEWSTDHPDSGLIWKYITPRIQLHIPEKTEPYEPQEGRWTPGLWDELWPVISYLDSPDFTGDSLTLTLKPAAKYPEMIRMIERWADANPTFALLWENTGAGIRMWIGERIPVPVQTSKFVRQFPLSASPTGKCWARFDGPYKPCTSKVGVGQMSYKIDGKPVCQRHFNMVARSYPDRCEAEKIQSLSTQP